MAAFDYNHNSNHNLSKTWVKEIVGLINTYFILGCWSSHKMSLLWLIGEDFKHVLWYCHYIDVIF